MTYLRKVADIIAGSAVPTPRSSSPCLAGSDGLHPPAGRRHGGQHLTRRACCAPPLSTSWPSARTSTTIRATRDHPLRPQAGVQIRHGARRAGAGGSQCRPAMVRALRSVRDRPREDGRPDAQRAHQRSLREQSAPEVEPAPGERRPHRDQLRVCAVLHPHRPSTGGVQAGPAALLAAPNGGSRRGRNCSRRSCSSARRSNAHARASCRTWASERWRSSLRRTAAAITCWSRPISD